MLEFLWRPIADWLAFHDTHAALRGLDPHLRADLGLGDADLRRLSRKAAGHKGPITVYQLAYEDFEEVGGETPSAVAAGLRVSRSSPTTWRGKRSLRLGVFGE